MVQILPEKPTGYAAHWVDYPDWPRPPSCTPACLLPRPPGGTRIAVAGLVILRQRPGTAKGVVFLTLEDETGVVNVIIWRKVFLQFRRAIISGRMLKITGPVQHAYGVDHVIAEKVEDISAMLDELLREKRDGGLPAPRRRP